MATEPNTPSGLHRSRTNQIIAGVCSGIGLYFAVDPNIVRLLFAVLTLFGGSGIIIYILLWIILPYDSAEPATSTTTATTKPVGTSPFIQKYGHSNQFWIGIIIIGLGLVLLLNNLGFLSDSTLNTYWPIILVVVGLAILLRKR